MGNSRFFVAGHGILTALERRESLTLRIKCAPQNQATRFLPACWPIENPSSEEYLPCSVDQVHMPPAKRRLMELWGPAIHPRVLALRAEARVFKPRMPNLNSRPSEGLVVVENSVEPPAAIGLRSLLPCDDPGDNRDFSGPDGRDSVGSSGRASDMSGSKLLQISGAAIFSAKVLVVSENRVCKPAAFGPSALLASFERDLVVGQSMLGSAVLTVGCSGSLQHSESKHCLETKNRSPEIWTGVPVATGPFAMLPSVEQDLLAMGQPSLESTGSAPDCRGTNSLKHSTESMRPEVLTGALVATEPIAMLPSVEQDLAVVQRLLGSTGLAPDCSGTSSLQLSAESMSPEVLTGVPDATGPITMLPSVEKDLLAVGQRSLGSTGLAPDCSGTSSLQHSAANNSKPDKSNAGIALGETGDCCAWRDAGKAVSDIIAEVHCRSHFVHMGLGDAVKAPALWPVRNDCLIWKIPNKHKMHTGDLREALGRILGWSRRDKWAAGWKKIMALQWEWDQRAQLDNRDADALLDYPSHRPGFASHSSDHQLFGVARQGGFNTIDRINERVERSMRAAVSNQKRSGVEFQGNLNTIERMNRKVAQTRSAVRPPLLPNHYLLNINAAALNVQVVPADRITIHPIAPADGDQILLQEPQPDDLEAALVHGPPVDQELADINNGELEFGHAALIPRQRSQLIGQPVTEAMNEQLHEIDPEVRRCFSDAPDRPYLFSGYRHRHTDDETEDPLARQLCPGRRNCVDTFPPPVWTAPESDDDMIGGSDHRVQEDGEGIHAEHLVPTEAHGDLQIRADPQNAPCRHVWFGGRRLYRKRSHGCGNNSAPSSNGEPPKKVAKKDVPAGKPGGSRGAVRHRIAFFYELESEDEGYVADMGEYEE